MEVDDFVVLNATDGTLPFYPHDEHNLVSARLGESSHFLTALLI